MSFNSVNELTLLGYVGAVDRHGSVVKLRVATDRSVKSGDNWESTTDWHTVTVFGKTAEFCSVHVQTGDRVFIRASVRYSEYEVEGRPRKGTDIVCGQLIKLNKSGTARPRNAEPADDIPF